MADLESLSKCLSNVQYQFYEEWPSSSQDTRMRVHRLAAMPLLAENLKIWGPYLLHHWSDWRKISDFVLQDPNQRVYQVS